MLGNNSTDAAIFAISGNTSGSNKKMNIHPETQLVEDADHLKIIEEEELGCHQEFHKYEHPYYITGTN